MDPPAEIARALYAIWVMRYCWAAEGAGEAGPYLLNGKFFRS